MSLPLSFIEVELRDALARLSERFQKQSEQEPQPVAG
jgi:hypothetical protein